MKIGRWEKLTLEQPGAVAKVDLRPDKHGRFGWDVAGPGWGAASTAASITLAVDDAAAEVERRKKS